MNAVHWNRDLSESLDEIRERERDLRDLPDRGRGVVAFPEMLKGSVRFCVATQIGHSVSRRSPVKGWNSPEIAWAQTQAQLAWYREMERRGLLRQITSQEALCEFRRQVESGDDSVSNTIGFVLSLEGADSLVQIDYLHRAYQYGLRIVGPAHYGPGRYAAGTGSTDGFTPNGFDLLREIQELGMILDVTHLTDLGLDEALDAFGGPLWASHHNCRSLVDHPRQLTDDQVRKIIQRRGLVATALDAWMLVPGWVRGESTPEGMQVTLQNVADQIDHVCQLAGDARHAAIGSDLDGGFGSEQTPMEVDSIARLGELGMVLADRGYSREDIERILFENAFEFLRRNLPPISGEPGCQT